MTENPGPPPSGGQQPSWGANPVTYGSPVQAPGPKPNMLMALLAGFMASILGAVIWGGITYVTHYKIGIVAIGVGFVVGWAVKYFGNGSTMAYGIIGAFFAFLGCVLGNLLAVLASAAIQEGVPFLTIVLAFLANPMLVFLLLQETASFMDILFYGIAIYEGFRFSMGDSGSTPEYGPGDSDKPISLGINDPQPSSQGSHNPPPPPPPASASEPTPAPQEPAAEEKKDPPPIPGGL